MFLPDQKFFLREIFLITVGVACGVMLSYFVQTLSALNLFLAPLSTLAISMILSLAWAVFAIIILYKSQSVYEKNEAKIKKTVEKISSIGKKPAEGGHIAGAGQNFGKKP